MPLAIKSEEYSWTTIYVFVGAGGEKTVALHIIDAQTVELRAPHWVSDSYLDHLMETRRTWLAQKLSSLPAPQAFGDGDKILLFGLEHTIRWLPPTYLKTAVEVRDQEIWLPVNSVSRAKKVLVDYLRSRSSVELLSRFHAVSQLTGLTPSNVLIRSFKARWGSCDSQGLVKLNWRLVMAPEAVIDYVIVHELAHLKEMNHSTKFWQQVERWEPNHRVHRDWLKKYGPRLMHV